jgi:cell division initiation protein
MLKTDDFALSTSDIAAASEPRRLPGAERHLSVTPLDLRQAKFGTTMRGFDKTEVTAFLLEAADGFEQALRDNDRLRQDLLRLETTLAQFRELEGSLKSTLMSAQKVADDMLANAQQESTRIQREAEGRAELLLEKAQARYEDVQREIDGLKLKRREAETSIESTISALRNTLEYVREQDQREQPPKPAAHAFQVVK